MAQAHVSVAKLNEPFDDFNMTFQVALIGDDCAVLGSDRLLVERGLRGFIRGRTPHQSVPSRKICWPDDGAVVCAFAGGPYAETTARSVASSCVPQGLSDLAWRNCLEAAARGGTEYEEHILDEILVVRCDNCSILKMVRQGCDRPTFTPVEAHICAGLDANARALPQLLWRERMSAEELTTLAILTIEAAHQEFPSYVGCGADIAIISTSARTNFQTYTSAQCADILNDFVANARQRLRPVAPPIEP